MNIRHLIIAAVAASGLASSPLALAHARLESTSPQADSVVTPAPGQLRLQFSEPLELPFSKVKLVDEQGAAIAPLKTAIDAANQKVLVATVPALHAGAYRVLWSTVTRDGHKVKGEFAFRVK